MPAFIRNISASVGRNGINIPSDMRTIMFLLNQVSVADGGADVFFNGSESATVLGNVIERFQRVQFNSGDGRVDVGGRTLRRLREFDQSPSPVNFDGTRAGKKGFVGKKTQKF